MEQHHEEPNDPRLINGLDKELAAIQGMMAKRQHLLEEYTRHAYLPNATGVFKFRRKQKQDLTPADERAIKNYMEHNDDPLYIAAIKMAITLIVLLNANRLKRQTFYDYADQLAKLGITADDQPCTLANLMRRLDFMYKFPITTRNSALMEFVTAQEAEENAEWNRKMEQERAAEKAQDERMRMSNLTRGGGTKTRKRSNPRTRKALRKASRKASIAAAIKDIPLSKARADFAALKALPCPDINQAAKVGNAAMDHYFFRHRLAAKTKRDISYYDWINTDWKRNEAEHRLYKFNLAQGKTPEKARYGVFRLYYGAIHGFKPVVAKWLYCMYQPRVAVLDFSAGWGGRCLGAMALGIPYIGIDTNTDLRPVYERMVKELDPPALQDKVTMRFQDAAATDFSKFKYDMVFTSPPYFKTVRPVEGYAHMPHYADRADFNARFLFPVIRSTFLHLARGGTYALNVPDDMCDEIRAAGILPPKLHAKHRLFIQPRFAKGNPNHPDVQYNEHIYVWKKA